MGAWNNIGRLLYSTLEERFICRYGGKPFQYIQFGLDLPNQSEIFDSLTFLPIHAFHFRHIDSKTILIRFGRKISEFLNGNMRPKWGI